MDKETAKRILMDQLPGIFILRFSDTSLGHIAILLRSKFEEVPIRFINPNNFHPLDKSFDIDIQRFIANESALKFIYCSTEGRCLLVDKHDHFKVLPSRILPGYEPLLTLRMSDIQLDTSQTSQLAKNIFPVVTATITQNCGTFCITNESIPGVSGTLESLTYRPDELTIQTIPTFHPTTLNTNGIVNEANYRNQSFGYMQPQSNFQIIDAGVSINQAKRFKTPVDAYKVKTTSGNFSEFRYQSCPQASNLAEQINLVRPPKSMDVTENLWWANNNNTSFGDVILPSSSEAFGNGYPPVPSKSIPVFQNINAVTNNNSIVSDVSQTYTSSGNAFPVSPATTNTQPTEAAFDVNSTNLEKINPNFELGDPNDLSELLSFVEEGTSDITDLELHPFENLLGGCNLSYALYTQNAC